MALIRSRYNFSVLLPEGRLALYNSKTGAVVVSEAGQLAMMQAVLDRPEDHTQNPFLPSLVSQGFLVDDTHDEIADIRGWYAAFVTDQRLLHVTMLPAEACNFACPYCFQYNKRHLFMKPWVYRAVLRLIERSTLENRNQGEQTYVKLSWFGGEPTLATREIVAFSKELKKLRDRVGFELRCGMVTNGYLLTPRLFRRLLAAGVRDFQVTLDGDQPAHDKLRVLKDGGPTFATIYRNLKGIAELPQEFQFRMGIRANFVRTTVPSAKNLIDMFVSDFGHDPRFFLYCRPVYSFLTTRTDIDAVAPDICTLEEGLGFQNMLALMILERLGLNELGRMFDPLPRPIPAWCPQERWYSYVFGADGLLFACDTLLGDDKYAIGRILPTGDVEYSQNAAKWKAVALSAGENACISCKLLPICMGGCARARFATPSESPCLWREDDILRGLRAYAELRLGLQNTGSVGGAVTSGRKEVRSNGGP